MKIINWRIWTHSVSAKQQAKWRELIENSQNFYQLMNGGGLLENSTTKQFQLKWSRICVLTASTAAVQEAHKSNPATFCIVSDAEIQSPPKSAKPADEGRPEGKKFHIRLRMPENWKADLKPLGTKLGRKPFLEDAPYLIVVFKTSPMASWWRKNPALLCDVNQ